MQPSEPATIATSARVSCWRPRRARGEPVEHGQRRECGEVVLAEERRLPSPPCVDELASRRTTSAAIVKRMQHVDERVEPLRVAVEERDRAETECGELDQLRARRRTRWSRWLRRVPSTSSARSAAAGDDAAAMPSRGTPFAQTMRARRSRAQQARGRRVRSPQSCRRRRRRPPAGRVPGRESERERDEQEREPAASAAVAREPCARTAVTHRPTIARCGSSSSPASGRPTSAVLRRTGRTSRAFLRDRGHDGAASSRWPTTSRRERPVPVRRRSRARRPFVVRYPQVAVAGFRARAHGRRGLRDGDVRCRRRGLDAARRPLVAKLVSDPAYERAWRYGAVPRLARGVPGVRDPRA